MDDASLLYSQKQLVEHKVFKNILFNAKQIFILRESDGKTAQNWVWQEMTSDHLSSLYNQENRFYLGRISMSQKLQDSLSALGMTVSNTTRGVANAKHNVGYRYFIISSEPVTLMEYLDLLPQTRAEEPSFVDIFDEIDYVIPELTPEDDYSYTYHKSNYVFQDKKYTMTLKNTIAEPAGEEAPPALDALGPVETDLPAISNSPAELTVDMTVGPLGPIGY